MRNLAHLRKEFLKHIQRALRYHTVYHARLDAVDVTQVKPVTVYRADLGVSVEAYVTQRMVDLWTSGQVLIDDIVLVAFSDGDPDKAIVLDKVYKSW